MAGRGQLRRRSATAARGWRWLLVAALAGLPVQASAVGRVDPSGSLATTRYAFGAALLPDGKVLVAGGFDSGSALATAGTELFDPATGRWTASGSLFTARYGHTLTVLQDGRVLAVGGNSGGTLINTGTVEVWDPGSGRWTVPAALGEFPRMNHTATLLADGKVLLAGGDDGTNLAFSTVALWDPATGDFVSPAPANMSVPRTGHTATRIGPGRVLVTAGRDVIGVHATHEIWDQATGWTPAAAGPTARHRHSATRLPDGRVLVAGGRAPSNLPTSTLEVWDPSSGWSGAGSLATARQDHSASLLADGRVLLGGGTDAAGNGLASTEIWTSPSTLTADTGIAARSQHGAVLLPDGRLLFVGGFGADGSTSLGDSRIWERGDFAWSVATPITPAPRRVEHRATLLPDGTVLVTGGWNNDNSNNALRDTYRWNPAGDAWTGEGDMSADRYVHTATLLPDGKVLVVGGFSELDGALSTAETWDPTLGWQTIPTSGQVRAAHTATLLADGRVLVVGGCSATNGSGVCLLPNYLTSVKIWDGTSWSDGPPLAQGRESHTATLLPDGRVLVAGGCATDGGCGASLASVEIYDPVRNAWDTLAGLNQGREKHIAVLLADGRVLVSGGFNAATLSSTEIWDPRTQTWTTVTPMTSTRRRHRAVLLPDGRVLAAGGYDSSGLELNTSEIYDPATGFWSSAGSFAGFRQHHSLTLLLDGRAFLFGGADNGNRLSTANVWTPSTVAAPALCVPVIGPLGSDLPADPWPSGSTIRGFGIRLKGCSEGSSGRGGANATANLPVVRLQSLSNGSLWDGRYTRSRDWTSAQLDFSVPGDSGLASGHYALQVVVNGIPSATRVVRLNRDHRKYYAHREDGTAQADTHDLSEQSPQDGSVGHMLANIRNPVLCQELTPDFLLGRIDDEGSCPNALKGGSLVFAPGAATAVSGPWVLRADVRRVGGGATDPSVRLFARIKHHESDRLIHQTRSLPLLLASPDFPVNAWREVTLRFVVPPRAADAPGCPSVDPNIACASTTIPAGDRVRVEWWLEVVSGASAARTLELALEAPGSTAASFATLTTEILVGPSPTVVRVSDLSARRAADGVETSWILDRTDDVLEMAVLSGPGPDGPWAGLQSGIQVALDAENGPYAVLDPAPPEDPWYLLEVLLADGTIEAHGPVTPPAPALEQGAPGCSCRISPRRSRGMLSSALLLLAAAWWRFRRCAAV